MKPQISLSINPSYYCNFRCSFCYLSKEELGTKDRLAIKTLAELIGKIAVEYQIVSVDVYGGEPQLLPYSYLKELKCVLLSHGISSANINTNLSVITPVIDDPFYYPSVSFDFDAREKSDKVITNMLKLGRDFSVVSVGSRQLMKNKPTEVLGFLENLTHLVSYEIKPYSQSLFNTQHVPYVEYENYVMELCSHHRGPFRLVNLDKLKDVLDGNGHSFSDDHLYIRPNGAMAVLDFDLNGLEFFRELDDLDAYRRWCVSERLTVGYDSKCGSCKYIGKCLSEHLNTKLKDSETCSGFRRLIRWGEQNLGR